MSPRVAPDSFIVAVKTPQWLPKRVGQMYYIEHPRYGKIVKALASIENNNTMWFRGESASSVSIDAIGIIKNNQLIGKVLFVIPPPKKPHQ